MENNVLFVIKFQKSADIHLEIVIQFSFETGTCSEYECVTRTLKKKISALYFKSALLKKGLFL